MENINLNLLAREVHANAKAKGFWDSTRNRGELFMLIVSELGEALEAHRKGKFANLAAFKASLLMDDVLEQDKPLFEIDSFKRNVKDTFEDEIADVVIRILDYVGFRGDVEIDFARYNRGELQIAEDVNVGEALMEVVGYVLEAYRSTNSLAFLETTASFLQLEDEINAALILLYNLSVSCGFDLPCHIEAKMRFNATRERLHGKAY